MKKSIDPSATCSMTQKIGADAKQVIAFNKAMNVGSTASSLGLNEVNIYAGDVEFNNDGSTDPSPLEAFKLKVNNKGTTTEKSYDGAENIISYHDTLQGNGVTKFMAVVDGRADALGVPNGWLWSSSVYNNGLISHNFNNLSPKDAITFADHIANQFCDPSSKAAADINGVQFDLEGFHIQMIRIKTYQLYVIQVMYQVLVITQ